MVLSVKIAKTEEEMHAIYQFRYDIYVKEIGLKQTHACHVLQTVQEPFDKTADLFFARHHGKVVGVARSNYAKHNNLGFYPDIYDLHDLLKSHNDATMIASKLLIDESYRKTQVSYRIVCEQYKKALKEGIKFAFLDCIPSKSLVDFYIKLGFKEHKNRAQHPDTGTVTVLKLALNDRVHLQSVKSPFCRYYTDNNVD